MLVQGKAPGGLMGWIDPKRLQIIEKQSSSPLGARANSPASLLVSFVRKGGCSFEQPPFLISIRFERKK